MKKTLIILSLFTQLFYYGQDQRYVDSVKALTSSKIDSLRFSAYSELVWVLKGSDNKAALKYASALLQEAKKANSDKWTGQGYNDLGIVYYKTGDFKNALENFEQSLLIRKKLGNKKDIASSLSKIAIIKRENGDYARSYELQLQALKCYEELNILPYIAQTCNNLGQLCNNLKNFSLSNSYLKRAYKISEELHDAYGMAGSMAVIAKNFDDVSKVDSALIYYDKAKKLFKKAGDPGGYATACSNMGYIYRRQKKNKEGIAAYKEAIEIAKQSGDSASLNFYEGNLANILISDKKFSEAEKILLNLLAISKRLGNGEIELKNYKSLAELYIQMKDPAKATFYFDAYKAFKDTIFSKQTAEQFTEMQTRYETEKKDLELAKHKAELKTKEEQAAIKNVIFAAVVITMLLLIITGITFYRKRQLQQKADLDAELARQKEMRNRAVIEAEEKERIRIATDLHDGVGQMLSAAKLNLSGLEHKLNMQNPEQQMAFKTALDLVDDSVKEVRVVSHNMMPNTLLKLGLASAVKEFITKIQGTPNLKVNLEIVGMDQRLEQEKEAVLYRVIQELVSNIIKHAKASELTLQLIRHDKELTVLIEDNGVGFDASKINDFEGIGLKNIMSRVEFINGTVHFDSALNRGTTVVIEVTTETT